MDNGLEAMIDPMCPTGNDHPDENTESSFGPWMLVSRRRGKGGGREGAGGGVGHPTLREAHAGTTDPSLSGPNGLQHTRLIHLPRGGLSSRGRGGHMGNRYRGTAPLVENAVDFTLSAGVHSPRDLETPFGEPPQVLISSYPPVIVDPGPSSNTSAGPIRQLLSSH